MRVSPDRPLAGHAGAGSDPGWPEAVGRRTEAALLLSLCAVALTLRLAGVSYGLPEHIYHEDTPKQLWRVPRFLAGSLVLEDTYPTLHMYVVALLLKGLHLLDAHAWDAGPSMTQVAVTARVLNAVLSTALVPLAYGIGKRVLDWQAGALAAAFLSVSSLHVLHAHHEMGDIPQTFFVAAAVAGAVGAFRAGPTLGFVLAGAAAGLAASAKYYGAIVLGALAVAALPGLRRRPVAWLGRLALAGVTAGAAFALTTPKLLLTPVGFWQALGEAFETKPPPPLLHRPLVAGKALLGLSLEWFGPAILILAALGAVAIARRGLKGWVLLTTPALVVGLYAAARAHRLDERNLLILTPFLFLAAGVALAWPGRRSRWAGTTAAVAAAALLGWAALDAVHVAYLFTVDDTRVYAQRWLARHVPDSARILRTTYRDSLASYRALDGDAVLLDSKEWLWDTAWYAPRRAPDTGRALAFLAERGKLLRRFELLPRGFIAPTLAYYDLGSMAVPHAFPPPDDVARSLDPLVFVDGAAVPEPTGVVVPAGRTVALTLVSPAPLGEVTVAVSGHGRLVVRQGQRTLKAVVEPGDLRLLRIEPRRAFPWFKHVYPLRLEASDGAVYARLLPTPCDAGRTLVAAGRWAPAVPALEACQGARWVEPARLLDLAHAQARLGKQTEARAALEGLRRAAPGLLDALADLARQEDGEAWREGYRALAGHPAWFWQTHTFRFQAEDAPLRAGAVVDRRDAAGGKTLLAGPGLAEPGYTKIWFPQHFLRGAYVVRFRLRGVATSPGPLATLSVVRHFHDAVLDVPVSEPWSPRRPAAGFEEVSLRIRTAVEPVKLEARVYYHGGGTLEVDDVTILPDVRAELVETLAGLRPILVSR